MLKTDLEYLESDLREVINLFDGAEKLNIRHMFQTGENKVVNTVVLSGKAYAFGNVLRAEKDGIEYKRLVKRYAKLSVYKALSAYFNKQLPWGALTGIRPTKLAYQQLENSGEFEDFFINTMKVSKEKTSLVKNVLDTQKGIYEKNDENTDFFVFIPFCPTRCKYCSFISQDIKSAVKLTDKYVDTLVYEIEKSKKFIKNLRSIYVGGGTPVSLSVEQLDRVLTAIDSINTGVEYTVEAGRPDAITIEKIEVLKKHRVNRICINPQTFNDKTLSLIGRNHTAKDVLDKFPLVKDNFIVNMDLIAGLENESFEDFKYSLDTTLSLSPDNITVHTLCVKNGSYLANEQGENQSSEVDKMVDYAYKALTEKGYKPYYLYRQKYMKGNLENVGYAKDGKASIYNIDVMEEISRNVACGANASNKVVFNGGERIERKNSPKDVKTYIEKIEKILEDKEKLFS